MPGCLAARPPPPLRVQVAALGMPPPERRAESLQALQGLDFFGGQVPDERQLLSWEARHADDRIVLLSDVWLDRPEVLDNLHTVLAGGWAGAAGHAAGHAVGHAALSGPAGGGGGCAGRDACMDDGEERSHTTPCRGSLLRRTVPAPRHPPPMNRLSRRLQPAGAAALAVCADGRVPVVRRQRRQHALRAPAGALCGAGEGHQPVPGHTGGCAGGGQGTGRWCVCV